MRSLMEGTSPAAKNPLHRAARGPPPPEIRGRKELYRRWVRKKARVVRQARSAAWRL
jgi:hypothetical protein